MGLIDKIKYICQIAKDGKPSNEQKEQLIELSKEHSNDCRMGKVFGYSVSDFAIACFKWINETETYNRLIKDLSEDRLETINRLIATNAYELD